MIFVADATTNDVAAVVPNVTAVAPVKPVPRIVTVRPPVVDPETEATLVMVGPVDAASSCWMQPLTLDTKSSLLNSAERPVNARFFRRIWRGQQVSRRVPAAACQSDRFHPVMRSRTAIVSSRPGPTPMAEMGALIIFSRAVT